MLLLEYEPADLHIQYPVTLCSGTAIVLYLYFTVEDHVSDACASDVLPDESVTDAVHALGWKNPDRTKLLCV